MWETIGTPGFFGKKRDEIYKGYDERYGLDNWRISWEWNGEIIPWLEACKIYEHGYFVDSKNRENLWIELIKEAKEVYDSDISNIESGLDYMIQEATSTHLQDISIRSVVFRRGWKFQGNKLIQIRSHNEYWGQNLSPGKVPFHLPDLIIKPHVEGWWDVDSIEDFYQSNKVLQVKK